MDYNFPKELIGRRILLATESLGPINGVSRTTQSLVSYLRDNGVVVATCAPAFRDPESTISRLGQERQPIINGEWLRRIEAKISKIGSRAIGGAWQWHVDWEERQLKTSTAATERPRPRMLMSSSSSTSLSTTNVTNLNVDEIQASRQKQIDLRLRGVSLPYNPDLTVAYPFHVKSVFSQAFKPDLIYLASPASVGFQFLVQLDQFSHSPPIMLNFQTDLAAYSAILFPPPFDRYGAFLLQRVQGFLFCIPAVHTIFYPSDYVRRYMEDAGAPAAKMHQLGRGVDTKLFNPTNRDEGYRHEIAPNGEIIFGYTCRLAPEKGFKFLAETLRDIRHTGIPFRMLIVGGNKSPMVEAEIRSYFSDLKDCVTFTGMLKGEALARAYASMDIFLHCSITETFGLVVLESLASGVPVIARDEGGPSETVQNGRSGFLVPPNDIGAFVAKAVHLATNSSLRADMSQEARAQALDTTWRKINLQVARKMTEALASCEKGAISTTGSRSPWLTEVRLHAALAVICVFWLIAVVPLMGFGFVFVSLQKLNAMVTEYLPKHWLRSPRREKDHET